MPDDARESHRKRDAESLTIIGAFFALMAFLVLIGVVWHDRGVGLAVGIVAGLILMAVGVGAVLLGVRIKRRP